MKKRNFASIILALAVSGSLMAAPLVASAATPQQVIDKASQPITIPATAGKPATTKIIPASYIDELRAELAKSYLTSAQLDSLISAIDEAQVYWAATGITNFADMSPAQQTYLISLAEVSAANVGINFTAPQKTNVSAGSAITRIHVPSPETIYVQKGKSATIPALAYQGTAVSKVAPVFKSSKTAVATVSAAGVVKAKKTGTTKITVSANHKSITLKVKVVSKAKKVKKITTNISSTLRLGKAKYTAFNLSPKTATQSGAVKFSSSKSSVLTVDKSGKIVAQKQGTATVTIKVGGKTYKKKIKVTHN